MGRGEMGRGQQEVGDRDGTGGGRRRRVKRRGDFTDRYDGMPGLDIGKNIH